LTPGTEGIHTWHQDPTPPENQHDNIEKQATMNEDVPVLIVSPIFLKKKVILGGRNRLGCLPNNGGK